MKKNQIILGDSIKEMKKLKDHSVDLIFADPPYNLQLKDTLYRPDQTTVEAVTQDWDKPNLLAFSITMTFAFGKSIPTSITVVETIISIFLFKNSFSIFSFSCLSILP